MGGFYSQVADSLGLVQVADSLGLVQVAGLLYYIWSGGCTFPALYLFPTLYKNSMTDLCIVRYKY